MKINVSNAVKLFFPTTSLEMVYFEAIVNSIDAKAESIDININIDSYANPETLTIVIKDNGDGFTDRNFEKFTRLLEIEEEDHKGVGRLVFLNYFKKVDISSHFDSKKRTFLFNNSFDGESKIIDLPSKENETILVFSGYTHERIKSYDYLKPSALIKSIQIYFYPLLYSLKINNRNLKINIQLDTKESNLQYDFYSDRKDFSIQSLPNLESISFDATNLNLFEKFQLYYSINQNYDEQVLITSICADGRTIPVEIFAKENIPQGYKIIFLLYSNIFDGIVDSSRQILKIDDTDLRTIKKLFREYAAKILNEKIPIIQERNVKTTESLNENYPHLLGYFEDESVGLIDRNKSLEIAQTKFFQAQKDILESSSLTDELYFQSLEMSSRLLTEYILYRNIIIHKLKEIDFENSESDIHKLIVPMHRTIGKSTFINDLYANNAWLLDDKYMSYTTILSDKEMDELINNIALDDSDSTRDSKRPDIAIVFSDNPDTTPKVDVVIIELKKFGLNLAKREEVISQLKQRARKLVKYYPDRIQRIWFYGLVDINPEFKISLKEERYVELFSNGSVFYKEHPIIIDETTSKEIPMGIFILSYDAFLKDAESRNSTFLRLLKEGLKRKTSKLD